MSPTGPHVPMMMNVGRVENNVMHMYVWPKDMSGMAIIPN